MYTEFNFVGTKKGFHRVCESNYTRFRERECCEHLVEISFYLQKQNMVSLVAICLELWGVERWNLVGRLLWSLGSCKVTIQENSTIKGMVHSLKHGCGVDYSQV